MGVVAFHENIFSTGIAEMKIAVFSTQPYDREFLTKANAAAEHELLFFDVQLNPQTVSLAVDCQAVCCFVNDDVLAETLQKIHAIGIRLVLLRCSGFNNVDLPAAAALDVTILRVPAYSPHAVAEHTLALLLSLNRNIPRAWNRVREGDFRLQGLLGFDLFQKTVGVVGTGEIGRCVAEIFLGFGCHVLAYDPFPNEELLQRGVKYVPLTQLLQESRVITLHCPLMKETYHLINSETLKLVQPDCLVINTGRGALVEVQALIDALKDRRIGGVALDVYEEEASLFFRDHSEQAIPDDAFARLLTFPNVLITGHQGFFTQEALTNIARTTLKNATQFEGGTPDVKCVVKST